MRNNRIVPLPVILFFFFPDFSNSSPLNSSIISFADNLVSEVVDLDPFSTVDFIDATARRVLEEMQLMEARLSEKISGRYDS